MSIAPDSNIISASDEETIQIDVFGSLLPFDVNPDEIETSGVGVQIWTGGEYQHPLGNRLRLRAGVDVSRREYKERRFDEMNAGVHLGPRWLIDRRTEASLLGSLRRRWYAGAINYDAGGGRLEVQRRLGARVFGTARASWERRSYRETENLDGPATDLSLSGSWTITPVLRANALIGYGRERPELLRQRSSSRRVRAGLSAILPRGFNVSVTGQLRDTDYEGTFNAFTTDSPLREDLTRTLTVSVFKRDFTLFGFAPQLVVTHEERSSNARRGANRRGSSTMTAPAASCASCTSSEPGAGGRRGKAGVPLGTRGVMTSNADPGTEGSRTCGCSTAPSSERWSSGAGPTPSR